MMIYKDSERGRYEPPACPGCGARVEQAWIDVTTSWGFAADGERSATPGRWQCNTQGCQYGPPVVVFE